MPGHKYIFRFVTLYSAQRILLKKNKQTKTYDSSLKKLFTVYKPNQLADPTFFFQY